MIYANHAHVFPKEVRPDGTLDNLLRYMDDCKIDRAVAFAPFDDRFHKAGLTGSQNDWLAREVRGQDRIDCFGTIDFNNNLKDEVDRIAELGFKGIKMHPPYQEFVIDGPQAFQVYQRAEELGLFVSFHGGMHWHRLRDNRVILFDEVAWNFPNLRFSIEHIGGYHFFNEALAVMCNNSRRGNNVYAGWTTVADRDGPGAWALSDSQLETVIHQTGEDHSIFGLDFPYAPADRIKWDIQRIKRLNISEECKEKILGKTLNGLLNPSL